MELLKKPLHKRFSKKQQFLFFLIPLILAIVFQWFFFDHDLGINYPLFLAGLYLGYLSLFWDRIKKDSVTGWVLLVLSLLLSFVFIFFQAGPILVFNFLIIPVLALTSGFLLTGWNHSHWYDLAFIWEFFPKSVVKLLEHLPTPIRSFFTMIQGKTTSSTKKQILTGIIIAIPLLLVILSLLASADAVFDAFLSDITTFINVDIADELIGRVIITVLAFWGLASFAWMIASEKNDAPNKLTTFKPSISPVTTITVLSIVNLVYLVFVLIQFAYFFQGADLAFLENMTYAEYTRRGFGELITVTLINLSLVLGFSIFTKKESHGMNITKQVLSSFLILATAIILYSSHLRLGLYEQAYGFTYLRLFVHTFMIFLALSLISAMTKIWKPAFLFIKSTLIIGIATWTLLSFVNIDRVITQKNIERFHEHGRIDMHYLVYNLSSDALPSIVKFAQDEGLPMIKADHPTSIEYSICLEENDCYPFTMEFLDHNITNSWQEWNLPESREQKLIGQLRGPQSSRIAE